MSSPVPSPPPPATETRAGLLTTLAQRIAGLKTFVNNLVLEAQLRVEGEIAARGGVRFMDNSLMTTAPVAPDLSGYLPKSGGDMTGAVGVTRVNFPDSTYLTTAPVIPDLTPYLLKAGGSMSGALGVTQLNFPNGTQQTSAPDLTPYLLKAGGTMTGNLTLPKAIFPDASEQTVAFRPATATTITARWTFATMDAAIIYSTTTQTLTMRGRRPQGTMPQVTIMSDAALTAGKILSIYNRTTELLVVDWAGKLIYPQLANTVASPGDVTQNGKPYGISSIASGQSKIRVTTDVLTAVSYVRTGISQASEDATLKHITRTYINSVGGYFEIYGNAVASADVRVWWEVVN